MEENPTLPLTPLPTTRHYCPLQQGEQSTAQGEATRDRQLSPRTREGSVRMACGEGYWDELDRRQPNCLTKARPTAPPITAEHFPFRRRQRCHVSSVVPVIR
ncbi:hypothetical protein J6590_055248 [Homalodisca vitripennis]|nr:hypothetical protein J6590_055248 [Homalodisca vitripennis]